MESIASHPSMLSNQGPMRRQEKKTFFFRCDALPFLHLIPHQKNFFFSLPSISHRRGLLSPDEHRIDATGQDALQSRVAAIAEHAHRCRIGCSTAGKHRRRPSMQQGPQSRSILIESEEKKKNLFFFLFALEAPAVASAIDATRAALHQAAMLYKHRRGIRCCESIARRKKKKSFFFVSFDATASRIEKFSSGSLRSI